MAINNVFFEIVLYNLYFIAKFNNYANAVIASWQKHEGKRMTPQWPASHEAQRAKRGNSRVMKYRTLGWISHCEGRGPRACRNVQTVHVSVAGASGGALTWIPSVGVGAYGKHWKYIVLTPPLHNAYHYTRCAHTTELQEGRGLASVTAELCQQASKSAQ